MLLIILLRKVILLYRTSMTDLTSVVSKAYTYRVEKVYLLRCWQLIFCFFFSCSTFPCTHNGARAGDRLGRGNAGCDAGTARICKQELCFNGPKRPIKLSRLESSEECQLYFQAQTFLCWSMGGLLNSFLYYPPYCSPGMCKG